LAGTAPIRTLPYVRPSAGHASLSELAVAREGAKDGAQRVREARAKGALLQGALHFRIQPVEPIPLFGMRNG
jgi:hypothetical protein